ncbi:hypothetical protein OSTOST_16690, partial [Ostertagia ostertagi]
MGRNLMEERIMDEFNLRFSQIDLLPPGKKLSKTALHLLDTEPRDYADAFILKMKEEAMNGVMDTTFEWEIQRHASILNMNFWRFSSADAEIGGYAVPKHTIVSAELSLILSDEAIFPNSKE